MRGAAFLFVFASVVTGCTGAIADGGPNPDEAVDTTVDTTLRTQAGDAGADSGSTTDSGTGTNFPAESDPEGRVPTSTDTSGGCDVGHGNGPARGALLLAAIAAAAIVSARRRR